MCWAWRAESWPSGDGAATEGTGVAGSVEGGLGPHDLGRAAHWSPTGLPGLCTHALLTAGGPVASAGFRCGADRAGAVRRPRRERAGDRSERPDQGLARRCGPGRSQRLRNRGRLIDCPHSARTERARASPVGVTTWVCSTVRTTAASPSSSRRTVGARISRSTTPGPTWYPLSLFFARSFSGWTAFLGLLPAPGRRTEDRGGSDSATENRRDPRRKAGVLSFSAARPTTMSATEGMTR